MSDRIRILHVIESLTRGGAERQLVDMVVRMDRSRFANMVCHLYPKDDLQAMAPQLLALPNTVVLDHFGGIDADAQPDLGVLMSLLDSGRVWVKLSGPMRCTREDFPYAKVTPLARRLVDHAPERLIWGSDWPHVNMNDRAMPNDGDLVDLLKEWFPSESALRRILCENPAALFGFSAA
jgi:predicted TIM-barrel fold metal-dependent hydrolase